MKNNYYGFEYNYGKNTYVQGAPYGDGGTIYVFTCKKDRNQWIKGGSDFISEKGYRDVYSSKKIRAHLVRYFGYGSSEISTRDLIEYDIKHLGTIEDMRINIA